MHHGDNLNGITKLAFSGKCSGMLYIICLTVCKARIFKSVTLANDLNRCLINLMRQVLPVESNRDFGSNGDLVFQG